MKGDSIRVLLDVGNASEEIVFEARINGRKFKVVNGSKQITITELTHTNKVVKTARLATARVLAVIEEPIEEPEHQSESVPLPFSQGEK